jgi:hypothetical protein
MVRILLTGVLLFLVTGCLRPITMRVDRFEGHTLQALQQLDQANASLDRANASITESNQHMKKMTDSMERMERYMKRVAGAGGAED